MRATDRFAIATGVAMALGAGTLTPLTQDRAFWWMAALLVAGIALISALGRRAGLPAWLVHLLQLVLVVAVAGGLGLWWAPRPSGVEGNLARLGRFYLDAVVQVRTEMAPMTATRHVRWLMVLVVGLVAILADLLVTTLVAPAWALAPLLTLYLVPALALKQDLSWKPFVLLALGYLVVLVAESIGVNAGWTRNLSADTAEQTHTTWGAVRLAGMMAVPALLLALVLGSALPRIGSLSIDSSRPKGSGPLQMQDPTLDLARNLNLPVDRVVMTYTTDEARGLYLRTASLTVMDADGWHLAPVTLQDGALPAAPGLTQPGRTVNASVKVGDLGGEYLPVPYAPSSFNAAGQWRHDPVSLAIVSTRDENRAESLRNLEYTATSVLNDPVAETFSIAQPGTPSDAKQTAAVPSDVPSEIIKITHDVTKGAGSPVLKAAAIQAYLADPRNFSYSTTAPPGDGYDVLLNFLTTDKTGYCIHFASAMALMARIEGIPSRVSVGFLPGEQKDGVWEVKASNMHAWPELYFAGYGWVRFEPTSRVASAPDWTMVSDSVRPSTQPSASGSTSTSATPSPSSSPTPKPSTASSPSASAASQGGSFPWARILAWTAGILAALLVLAAPAMLREFLRRRRVGWTGDPSVRVELAWAEIRALVRDLRMHWPPGSPREKAAVVGSELDDEGREALNRLALLVEKVRYSRELGEVPDDLGVEQVRSGLLLDRSWYQRLLAFWVPASLGSPARRRLVNLRRSMQRTAVVSPNEPTSLDPGIFGRQESRSSDIEHARGLAAEDAESVGSEAGRDDPDDDTRPARHAAND